MPFGATPVVPKSFHLILKLEGGGAKYYVIDRQTPLKAKCKGAGRLELTLRRLVPPGETLAPTTTVKVLVDGVLRPPISFRRARDEARRFRGDITQLPSSPLHKKVTIPPGAHDIQLELAGGASSVAVSLRLRASAVTVAQAPDSPREPKTLPRKTPPKRRPPRVKAPPKSSPPPPTPEAAPALKTASKAALAPKPVPKAAPAPRPTPQAPPAPKATPPAATANTPDSPKAYPLPQATPPGAAISAEGPEVEEIMATLDAPTGGETSAVGLGESVLSGKDKELPVAAFDAGFGLENPFIDGGVPSPTVRLGGRYIVPWLDRLLSIGGEASIAAYRVRDGPTGAPDQAATNYVVPIVGLIAVTPDLVDLMHLEVGAGLGFALSYGMDSRLPDGTVNLGIGFAGLAYGEVGARLGPGVIYSRLQGDRIGASNHTFRKFDYFGASLSAGYRILL